MAPKSEKNWMITAAHQDSHLSVRYQGNVTVRQLATIAFEAVLETMPGLFPGTRGKEEPFIALPCEIDGADSTHLRVLEWAGINLLIQNKLGSRHQIHLCLAGLV